MRIAIIGTAKFNDESKLRRALLEAIKEWKPKEITELILVKDSPLGEKVIEMADTLNIAYSQAISTQEALVVGDAILCLGEPHIHNTPVSSLAKRLKKLLIEKNT
jgi:hypothetical protein